MSIDLKRREPDSQLISLTHTDEIRTWCKSLNCTESELRGAVATVGVSPVNVREYLRHLKS